MTLKIETTRDDGGTVLRLIGRIDSQNVATIESSVPIDRERVTLDLEEVTLVDIDAIHYLLRCESHGIPLLHCLPYIRAWMDRELTRGD
jgi:anti-anti-sigma regulatory factor